MDKTGQTDSMACSFPALNHLDIYCWGHPKSTVYVPKVSDVQELQQIQNGVGMISTLSQAITVQT
jgi:hypothetical protein